MVLVTDSGTRQVKKGTYFLACGRVGARTAEVTEAAWRTFRLAAAGTRDMQPGARRRAGRRPGRPSADRSGEVRFPGRSATAGW